MMRSRIATVLAVAVGLFLSAAASALQCGALRLGITREPRVQSFADELLDELPGELRRYPGVRWPLPVAQHHFGGRREREPPRLKRDR